MNKLNQETVPAIELDEEEPVLPKDFFKKQKHIQPDDPNGLPGHLVLEEKPTLDSHRFCAGLCFKEVLEIYLFASETMLKIDARGTGIDENMKKFAEKYAGFNGLFDVYFLMQNFPNSDFCTCHIFAVVADAEKTDKDHLEAEFGSWINFDENGKIILPSDFKALSE